MLSLHTAYDIQLALKQQLKALRKQRKLSVKALAELSGVPDSTIRKFEASGQISLRQFLMLHEALNNLAAFKAVSQHTPLPQSIEEVLKHA